MKTAIWITIGLILLLVLVKYPIVIKRYLGALVNLLTEERKGEKPVRFNDAAADGLEDIKFEMQALREKNESILSRLERLESMLADLGKQRDKRQDAYSFDGKLKRIEEYLQTLSVLMKPKECKQTKGKDKDLAIKADDKVLYATSIDSLHPLGFQLDKLSKEFKEQLFKIEKYSSNEATLTFVDDPKIHAVLLSIMPQMVKDGVCKIERGNMQGPTDIEILSVGKIRFTNDFAEITEKIIIKLI